MGLRRVRQGKGVAVERGAQRHGADAVDDLRIATVGNSESVSQCAGVTRLELTAKLRTCRCTLASVASWCCARAMASRAESPPLVPVPTSLPVSAKHAQGCNKRCQKN